MRILFLTAVLLVSYAFAGSPSLSAGGADAEYIGGTMNLPTRSGAVIRTTSDEFLELRIKRHDVKIPYERINLLEYGQKVDRRVALALVSPMFLLSKKRQHYLTVGYEDETGKQQAVVFKVDKSHVRSVLVSLEARTGRKVQFQDDEARKAGKG